MEILQVIIHVMGSLVFLYFFAYALAYLVFALAALFYRDSPMPEDLPSASFAIFIPAYKEDKVILEVAEAAAAHESRFCRFDVIVIADSLQQKTLDILKKMPIQLVEVSFEKSTKSKALNATMATLEKEYEYAVVLDADNVMAPGFLDRIYASLLEGFSVVQGHRQDKNQNTAFAILDAVSEGVNNSIFRKGHRVLGLSAALIGSGFAARYDLFRGMMQDIQAVGGFDKELEIRLIKAGIRIGFSHSAVAYDEKVQQPEAFAQQRRRWLSAQFIYFSRYFLTACRQLVQRGNVDLFDKVMQMLSPPRVLLLGITAAISVIAGLLSLWSSATPWIYPRFIHWLILFGISLLSIMLAVPGKFYTRRTLIALFALPKAFGLMLLALFRLRGANKRFIHTRHG